MSCVLRFFLPAFCRFTSDLGDDVFRLLLGRLASDRPVSFSEEEIGGRSGTDRLLLFLASSERLGSVSEEEAKCRVHEGLLLLFLLFSSEYPSLLPASEAISEATAITSESGLLLKSVRRTMAHILSLVSF